MKLNKKELKVINKLIKKLSKKKSKKLQKLLKLKKVKKLVKKKDSYKKEVIYSSCTAEKVLPRNYSSCGERVPYSSC